MLESVDRVESSAGLAMDTVGDALITGTITTSSSSAVIVQTRLPPSPIGPEQPSESVTV